MSTTSLQHHVHSTQNIVPNKGMLNSYSDGLAPPPSLGNHPGSALSSDSGSSKTPSPETVISVSGVPNPFTRTSLSPAPTHSGMISVNWAAPPKGPVPQQVRSAPIDMPNAHAMNGAVVTASRIPSLSDMPQGLSSSAPAPAPLRIYNNNNNVPVARSASPENKGGLNNRRQKRLERNRESARLSRRRRKQYLEVLEVRVKNLSVEMDKGRRQHVAVAVDTLMQKKRQALADPLSSLQDVESTAASKELRVAGTFQTQQVASLSMSPHIKFLLWLSMQNDVFFRGGRASSERLSAARIGERMLSSGNDRVPPAHGMWPLFCNEVGLSYDQEERVRLFQKTLLASNEGWLQRHAASSSSLVMQSTHDCVQSLAHNIGQREKSVVSDILTEEQKRKFLSWADQNAERIANSSKGKKNTSEVDGNDGFKLAGEHHDAANLYILNHRFQNIISTLGRPDVLVNKATSRKFARRPSFESLGSVMAMDKEDELARDGTHASTGSLKRCASELSVADEERAQIHCIPPEEAEATAKPAIEAALGFVEHLIPKPPTPPFVPSSAAKPVFTMPPPQPKTYYHSPPITSHPAPSVLPVAQATTQQIFPSHAAMIPSHYSPHQVMTQTIAPVPAPMVHHQGQQFQRQPVYTGQLQQPAPALFVPSFLPPHLNAVPEEGFLTNDAVDDAAAEDFLFELAEEDWAIGEGFDDMNLLAS